MAKKEAEKKDTSLEESDQWRTNFEKAIEHVSASEKKALEAENARGLEDRKRLVEEAAESKKGSNEELHRKNEEAENGPDGAQDNQPLPEDEKIKHSAKPVSKPQNTSEGKQL